MSVINKLYSGIKYIAPHMSPVVKGTKPSSPLVLKGLKLDTAEFRTAEQIAQDIKNAYTEYSKSPYINQLLRENAPLSEANKKLISNLKLAINRSEPLTGKFVRGITGTRKMRVTPENIEKFVFNNPGFTSTTPIENKSFASSFSYEGNGAMLTFEITKPMKAYKASNYEVLFDTQAFTPDKFKIIHEGGSNYRVVQK